MLFVLTVPDHSVLLYSEYSFLLMYYSAFTHTVQTKYYFLTLKPLIRIDTYKDYLLLLWIGYYNESRTILSMKENRRWF